MPRRENSRESRSAASKEESYISEVSIDLSPKEKKDAREKQNQ